MVPQCPKRETNITNHCCIVYAFESCFLRGKRDDFSMELGRVFFFFSQEHRVWKMKPKPSVSQCLGDAAGVGFWGRVGEGVYLCSCRRSIDDPGAYFWNNQDQRRVYKTFPCVSILFWCIDERQRNTTGPLVFFENAPLNPSLRFERGARDAHKSRKEKKNTSPELNERRNNTHRPNSQYSSTPKTSNLLRSFGVWVMFRIKAPPGQSLARSLPPSSLDVL